VKTTVWGCQCAIDQSLECSGKVLKTGVNKLLSFELKIYYEICKKSSRAPKKSFAGTLVPTGIRLAITDVHERSKPSNTVPERLQTI
jgi:hypothetical protein